MSYLNDSERVLFLSLVMVARWDERHTRLGVVTKSLRAIQRELLPTWGPTKMSMVSRGLIRKNFVKRINKHDLEIIKFKLYGTKVLKQEQIMLLIEQVVLPTEHNVLE